MLCSHCSICRKYPNKCTKLSHVCTDRKFLEWLEDQAIKDIKPARWKPRGRT